MHLPRQKSRVQASRENGTRENCEWKFAARRRQSTTRRHAEALASAAEREASKRDTCDPRRESGSGIQDAKQKGESFLFVCAASTGGEGCGGAFYQAWRGGRPPRPTSARAAAPLRNSKVTLAIAPRCVPRAPEHPGRAGHGARAPSSMQSCKQGRMYFLRQSARVGAGATSRNATVLPHPPARVPSRAPEHRGSASLRR